MKLSNSKSHIILSYPEFLPSEFSDDLLNETDSERLDIQIVKRKMRFNSEINSIKLKMKEYKELENKLSE